MKFHQLTEYFVKAIDYNDMNSVRLVCGLHKSTMEDQYDLQEVLHSYSNMSSGEKFKHLSKEMGHTGEVYSEEDQVEITVMDLKLEDTTTGDSQCTQYKVPTESQMSSLLRETAIAKWWGNRKNSQVETKVKRLDKNKWGDWDALIKEELP